MVTLRKIEKTGLKALAYTTILSLEGRGSLRGIRWTDADTQAQLEYLKVTLDGDVVLDVSKDITAWESFNLLKSIVQNAVVNTTDENVETFQKIPFHSSLKIEYKRAAAGTNGLSITILHTIKDYFG